MQGLTLVFTFKLTNIFNCYKIFFVRLLQYFGHISLTFNLNLPERESGPLSNKSKNAHNVMNYNSTSAEQKNSFDDYRSLNKSQHLNFSLQLFLLGGTRNKL